MSQRSPIAILYVQGEEVSSEVVRRILVVKVTMREKKATTGELVLRDPDAGLFDSKMFEKGHRLGFVMGWSDAMEPRGPFVVKSARPVFPEGGEPTLAVTFQDLSQKLNKKQKRRRFSDVSPAQIVKKIAQEHGLGYDIESIEGARFDDDKPIIQANQTDAAFLQRLADRYGYVWGVEGGTLYFRRPADLDQLGQQADLPVLSYRINDWSLRSFSPEVKQQSGRKRKGAAQTQSNVDLLSGKSFTLDQIRKDIVTAVPALGELLQSLPGEENKSGEAVTDTGSPGVEKKREIGILDSITGKISFGFKNTPGEEAGDDPDGESEPGSESGAATPDSEDEAKQRGAAKVLKASELVDATVELKIASMRWRPGNKLLIAGVGERLSGRYRAVEVTQEVSGTSTFKTSMKVQKRTFLPDTTAKARIATAEQEAARGESPGDRSPSSAVSSPEKTTPRQERVGVVDSIKGTTRVVTRMIDGQEDSA